jgi:hypothetical protein
LERCQVQGLIVDGGYAVGVRESDEGDCPRVRFQSAVKSLGVWLVRDKIVSVFRKMAGRFLSQALGECGRASTAQT